MNVKKNGKERKKESGSDRNRSNARQSATGCWNSRKRDSAMLSVPRSFCGRVGENFRTDDYLKMRYLHVLYSVECQDESERTFMSGRVLL
jgi:hypothetical protein